MKHLSTFQIITSICLTNSENFNSINQIQTLKKKQNESIIIFYKITQKSIHCTAAKVKYKKLDELTK